MKDTIGHYLEEIRSSSLLLCFLFHLTVVCLQLKLYSSHVLLPSDFPRVFVQIAVSELPDLTFVSFLSYTPNAQLPQPSLLHVTPRSVLLYLPCVKIQSNKNSLKKKEEKRKQVTFVAVQNSAGNKSILRMGILHHTHACTHARIDTHTRATRLY